MILHGPSQKKACCIGKSLKSIIPDRQGWCRTSGCPTRAGRAVMSMTPVPVCWQTTVTAENEKESCSTGFSACGGSRKRHSTIPPQCDPRGAFLSYGNEVSYTIIKNVPWHILAPRRGCFSNHLPLRRVRILAERFYRMETKFPIR